MDQKIADNPLRLLRVADIGEDKLRADKERFEKFALGQLSELGIKDVSISASKLDAAFLREKVERLVIHYQLTSLLRLNILPGHQLLAPPYDTSWNAGAGMPFSAFDGKAMVFGGEGFSASGFGIYLETDRHVAVSVMPQGRYKAGWSNFDPPSELSASGGTGTVVYSDGAELLSRTQRVWSVTSPPQFRGENFDMPFANTAPPALPGSLGTVRLAPVLFDMHPGRRYQIWFWVWHWSRSTEGRAFVMFGFGDIPLISIDVADPVIIH